MSAKHRILFVCIHNSARSQMAEAFMSHFAGGSWEAESAGLEPGTLNPLVVEAMREIGIDISKNKTKDVFTFVREGRRFDQIVTVCDEASGERCPVFPGSGERLHWSFDDPSSFEGPREEKLAKTRKVRDDIRSKVVEFLNSRREAIA